MARDPSFAPPVSELSTPLLSPPGVALDPTGGQGLSLNEKGIVPPVALERKIVHVQITSAVSVTGTSFVDVVSAGTLDFDGSSILIEFWCNRATAGASGTLTLSLRDGSTDLGQFFALSASETARTAIGRTVIDSPAIGAHTYKVSAINGVSQTSTVAAGAGGAGTSFPSFIRITRA